MKMARSACRTVLPIAILAAVLTQQGCQKKQVAAAPPAEPEVGFRSMEDLAPPPPQEGYPAVQPNPAPVYSPPAVALEPSRYTVQKGDTLWGIAAKTLGSGRRWKDIVAVNPGLDPQKLQIGQVLLIPAE
jgi:nucleoid-associated protein YgaU